jgi:hypothetical protein
MDRHLLATSATIRAAWIEPESTGASRLALPTSSPL